MKWRGVKLRPYLLAANAVSLVTVLGLLFFCYSRMILNREAFLWLGGATLAAGLLSFAVHYALIRPLERSVNRIGEASKEIASGAYGAEVPIVGPAEFRQLAGRFNGMSRRLAESFSRLRQAEISRRELVANVAHDLRTPLALLQSHAEALQDGVVRDEETVRRYLGTIRSESVRLAGLVQDLFELSAIDAGAEAYRPDKISLEDVLVETLNAYAPRLEGKRLEARVTLPEPTPIVETMDRSLRRIVGNLLDNAIRHSPEGGSILISAADIGGHLLVVRVQDEGEGVPEAERERIFERFYRADPSRRRDGSGGGLGLAIAKALAERHGGAIGVEPGPGTGSVFWFTVPLAVLSDTERRERA
ncbi:sensor histidine kinase [Cohnella candidum]|uniref:histidine kinase n=1 Tax=Cohnella candidum TaxID=2674991 RepID=A0A3G3K1B5_9BACL|nr:HAMP domain-containing sensor histidine kinase [Cohnella candidum]AYQ74248.1 sensor histidine kinase [Cohnella candidum]